MNCTWCGKQLDSIKVTVQLRIIAERQTSFDSWETISNSDLMTKEVLCQECFNHFTETLDSSMMKVIKDKK